MRIRHGRPVFDHDAPPAPVPGCGLTGEDLLRSPLSRLVRALGVAALPVLSWRCGGEHHLTSPGGGPSASITITGGTTVLNAPGATTQFSVTVKDEGGRPVLGVPVTWSSSNSAVATVSSSGLVTALAEGSALITAKSGALNASVTVTVAGGAYDVQLRFLTGGISAAQMTAFRNAAARWQRIITRDLPAGSLSAPAGSCGSNSPAVNERIDDLVILVTVEPIDGPYGVLGTASPCYVRGSSELPLLGRMRFDVADLIRLEQVGRVEELILHEMGHVLGFGTLWNPLRLLANPSTSLGSGIDTHFLGSRARSAFDAIGGVAYLSGNKVPVQNNGVSGSADSHWRESVMGNELMTPTMNAGTNPLSLVSIRSLEDLGYTVSTSAAEGFAVSFNLVETPPAASGDVALGDDVGREPIYRVDGTGRILGVIRR